MEWVRGQIIGHGSFGSVNLAIPRSQKLQHPPLMAVKSCSVLNSVSLVNEKLILDVLKDCPQIIQCYGDCITSENGENLYNLFLEYASGGDLAARIKNTGNGKLPEFEVQRLTKSILQGLHSIHYNGYAHCDIKPQNILLFGGNNSVKIADFGLAKKVGEMDNSGFELRGTPMYMSPEMVAGGEQETAADIWALGCLVAEMVSGAPAWRCRKDNDFGTLLMRIGVGEEVPEIPGNLCDEGKDFLGKCFVKDPRKRWTAEMLLSHPFVVAVYDEDLDSVTMKDDNISVSIYSPRSTFDFPDWVSEESCEIITLPLPAYQSSISPAERLCQLMTNDRRPEWSVLESWVTVR